MDWMMECNYGMGYAIPVYIEGVYIMVSKVHTVLYAQ